MKNFSVAKALIFDMDGVIVESERPKFLFLKKVFNDFKIQLEDDQFQKLVGRSVLTFLAEYLQKPTLEDKIWQIFQKDYLERITEYVSPIQPIVEFIKEYEGPIQIGIASSGIQKINEKMARHFGIIENVSIIVSREAVDKLKPAPDLYLKAAELLNVNPVDCIAIEDTIIGAQSALGAKMRCFIFLNGYNKKEKFINLDISGFIKNKKDVKDIITANIKTYKYD